MRPLPVVCDGCRKVPESSRVGAGGVGFAGPEDAIVQELVEGSSTRLIVRAESAAGRAETLVRRGSFAIAAVLVLGIAAQPSIALAILVVSAVVAGTGFWLSRVSGARSEFAMDGASLTAKGWRGGVLSCSPRDVREVRYEAKVPSVEHNRPRTVYDIVLTLDDGVSHTIRTQFRRCEYAEETVSRLKAAVARAVHRG
jgi:hypothetical protein